MKKKITKNGKFNESINYALEGIVTAIKTERNMRIHIFAGILVVILSLIFGVTGSDLKSLSFAVTLVFLAELLNTAIEATVDISTTRYHPLAKKAKDVAAGAVLIASLNALVIGYIIFSKKLKKDTFETFRLLKSSYIDTVLLVIFIVVVGVFIIKSYYKKGKLLHGGMPSGHSAVAFGLWVGVSYATENIVVTILTFGIALLVAQSRIEGRIHTPIEVMAGSVLGTFVTYILLKLIF
ncbi:MAG: diacylglycerol kinase [Psychrilyobacter sp.]|uniref:diacylglycerol kinase n=1 Tax=Psychrilyobacter sp. TaxID=2586924 RepID=UPI003C74A2D4